MEAVDGRMIAFSEPEGDRKGGGKRQHPDPQAADHSRTGGAQLLGFEGVTDGQPSIHGDAHDHVDAAVSTDKVEVFQEGAERPECARPHVIYSMHLGG